MLTYKELDMVMEIVGTLAFACSGAMVGIRKGMDFLGIIVLGITTAVGGGAIRDVILGITPPNMFRDSSYALQATIASALLFFIFYVKVDYLNSDSLKKFERVMIILDSIGLGAFTVTGINTALSLGYRNDKFLLIFVGVVTGVGGGVIRDVFSDRTPFIFEEEIYAVASLLGAMFYIAFLDILNADALMIGSALIVIIIRIIAVKKDINLPKINI